MFAAWRYLDDDFGSDAVRELEHAFDVLKADGVILFARPGTRYLGDPSYEEVFQELERRGVLHYLKRLYYNTALSTSEQVLAALKEFVPTSHVLDDKTHRAIDRDNALALFPRLARTAAAA